MKRCLVLSALAPSLVAVLPSGVILLDYAYWVMSGDHVDDIEVYQGVATAIAVVVVILLLIRIARRAGHYVRVGAFLISLASGLIFAAAFQAVALFYVLHMGTDSL